MRSARRLITTITLTVAFVAACAPPPAASPPATTTDGSGVRVELPTIPLPPAAAWQVSPDAFLDLACDACETGSPVDPARFFFGTAPMATVDDVVAGTAADRRAALGNIFSSGYFGGLRLRGALGAGGEDLAPFAPLLDLLGALTQSGLDSVVAGISNTAAHGSPQEVRDAAGAWAALLAGVSAHNRGYVEALVDRAPEGVDVSGALTCSSTFDCHSDRMHLASLDLLAGQSAKLASPPDVGWFAAAAAATTLASTATQAGRDAAGELPSSLTPEAYEALVDLSAGFAQVSQAAMLASLAGPTGGDVALARRGLETAAALVTWAGAHLLGFASPLSSSTMPTVTCG